MLQVCKLINIFNILIKQLQKIFLIIIIMNNSYNFLFDYFIIKKNISQTSLEKNSNIFKETEEDKISILNKYKIEIINYIINNKISIKIVKDSALLEYLDSNLNLLSNNSNNIESFFKKFINFKYDIIKINQNIYSFFNEKISFKNPITIENKRKFFKISYQPYNEHSSDKKKIDTTLQILTSGNFINVSIPSIGTIDNFYNFIKKFINIKQMDESILEILPFNDLEIYKKISEKLLDISNNNLYSFNKNSIETLIENMIKNIDIKFEDSYYINKKINPAYIIPYNIDIGKDMIKNFEKNELSKYKKPETIIQHNNELILYVLNKLDEVSLEERIKKLETQNYKNILYCYLFYVINIFTNILIKYVDNVDSLLDNILESKEERFKILNIKDAFDYTSLLQKSIFNLKYILLNNFYDLFLPAKILTGNYGMKIDNNKCYIPESLFLNSNDKILEDYPFKKDSPYTTVFNDQMIKVDEIKFKKFITNIRDKNNDIYKSDFLLEFGGEAYDNEIMENSINILEKYYKKILLNNNFTLFIIGKISDYFKTNNIPYNFIEDIKPYKDNMKNSKLSSNNRSSIEKKLIMIYDFNFQKFILFFIKYVNILKKIKNSILEYRNNFYSARDNYYLCSKAFFLKSRAIKLISEKYIQDIKLKVSILTKYNEIDKKYKDELNKYIKILKNTPQL